MSKVKMEIQAGEKSSCTAAAAEGKLEKLSDACGYTVQNHTCVQLGRYVYHLILIYTFYP
jgi:hypothetical protein